MRKVVGVLRVLSLTGVVKACGKESELSRYRTDGPFTDLFDDIMDEENYIRPFMIKFQTSRNKKALFNNLVKMAEKKGLIKLVNKGGGKDMTVAQTLKTNRLKRKMTLQQVADRIRSSRGFVHDLENGRRNPSAETKKKLRFLLR